MAGFNPIIYGRFWVITEANYAKRNGRKPLVSRGDLQILHSTANLANLPQTRFHGDSNVDNASHSCTANGLHSGASQRLSK
jgi:hypothetical protein